MGRVSNQKKKTIIDFAKQHGSHRAASKFSQNEDTIRAWLASERISNVAAKAIEKRAAAKTVTAQDIQVTVNVYTDKWKAALTCSPSVASSFIKDLAGL